MLRGVRRGRTNFDSQDQLDSFLADVLIGFSELERRSAFTASRMFSSYLKAGGKRTRILGDFLIGAHALNQADALLTLDRGFFREHFRGLKVIEP